jgi:DNA relaxase NicK
LLQERPKIKTSEERNEMDAGTNGDSGKGGQRFKNIFQSIYFKGINLGVEDSRKIPPPKF